MRARRAHVIEWIGPRHVRQGRAGRIAVTHQGQAIAPDGDLGAERYLGPLDSRAVEPRAVLALKIDDDVPIILEAKLGVGARDALLGIGQHDIVVTAAANLQPRVAQLD